MCKIVSNVGNFNLIDLYFLMQIHYLNTYSYTILSPNDTKRLQYIEAGPQIITKPCSTSIIITVLVGYPIVGHKPRLAICFEPD